MPLKNYLKINNIKIKDLAALLGVSRSYLYKLLNRKIEPKIGIALRIEDLTEGTIKAKDLIIYENKNNLK